MSRTYRPIEPGALPALLAARLDAQHGLVRAAVDGPAWAGPHELAGSLADSLRALGRPATAIRAETFWRNAAVRLEHGHEDVATRLEWLDADALRREVLDRIAHSGEFLPSLRDPVTNRTTREPRRWAAPNTVLIVSGEFLLGRGLPFDLSVHLALSAAARARSAAPDEQWLLAAFDRYDERVRPVEVADVVIRMDHPDRAAIRG